MFCIFGGDGNAVIAKIAEKAFEIVGVFVDGDCGKTEVLEECNLFFIVE